MDKDEIEEALFAILHKTVQDVADLTYHAEDREDIEFIFSAARRIFQEEIELEE